MNFRLKSILVLLLPIFLFSCNSDHEGHNHKEMQGEHAEHAQMSHGDHQSTATAEVFERKELENDQMIQIREVFRLNDELYKSFVDEEFDAIEGRAKEVASAIKDIENDEVRQLLEFSQKNLNDLGRNMEIETLQQAYSMISTALIHVLKTYDIGSGYNAYYCPMVKKRWIQNSEEVAQIQNPYDKSMRQCGDQETGF